ncbi:MAG TPA: hypothetical protein VN023_00960 [Methylovorus sp.]|nr:hypothetical protein [Methylovorus sp.]
MERRCIASCLAVAKSCGGGGGGVSAAAASEAESKKVVAIKAAL